MENNTENKPDDHFLLTESLIDGNKKSSDEKMNKYDYALDKTKKILKQGLVQNKNYSPDNIDSPKAEDPTTVDPANKKYLPFGRWTL